MSNHSMMCLFSRSICKMGWWDVFLYSPKNIITTSSVGPINIKELIIFIITTSTLGQQHSHLHLKSKRCKKLHISQSTGWRMCSSSKEEISTQTMTHFHSMSVVCGTAICCTLIVEWGYKQPHYFGQSKCAWDARISSCSVIRFRGKLCNSTKSCRFCF